MSSDRLFRVRVKQPYSTSVQRISSNHNVSAILPEVKEYIQLGDLCAFQGNDEKSWSIGRVTQFSKYKEKLKSERQFKGSKAFIDSSMGMLCACIENSKNNYLYTTSRTIEYVSISQSYICTLMHGCFMEASGAAISDTAIRSIPDVAPLHIANNLTLHQEVFDYINGI